MLNALTEFLARWADDITTYGFIGALTGAGPRVTEPHGRKAVVMRGTPAQRRLTQAMPRPAAHAAFEPANADSEWGPGSGLRHRREPQL